eukprot:3716207-Prymnesium_polylepis.2
MRGGPVCETAPRETQVKPLDVVGDAGVGLFGGCSYANVSETVYLWLALCCAARLGSSNIPCRQLRLTPHSPMSRTRIRGGSRSCTARLHTCSHKAYMYGFMRHAMRCRNRDSSWGMCEWPVTARLYAMAYTSAL